MAEDNFKLTALLLPLSKCWHHRWAPPLQFMLGMEPRALGMLGKYSTSLTIFSALAFQILYTFLLSYDQHISYPQA